MAKPRPAVAWPGVASWPREHEDLSPPHRRGQQLQATGRPHHRSTSGVRSYPLQSGRRRMADRPWQPAPRSRLKGVLQQPQPSRHDNVVAGHPSGSCPAVLLAGAAPWPPRPDPKARTAAPWPRILCRTQSGRRVSRQYESIQTRTPSSGFVGETLPTRHRSRQLEQSKGRAALPHPPRPPAPSWPIRWRQRPRQGSAGSHARRGGARGLPRSRKGALPWLPGSRR